ncbi:Nuclear fragile x mental retardation-interacting protein 1, partial [Globisporangium splendens]
MEQQAPHPQYQQQHGGGGSFRGRGRGRGGGRGGRGGRGRGGGRGGVRGGFQHQQHYDQNQQQRQPVFEEYGPRSHLNGGARPNEGGYYPQPPQLPLPPAVDGGAFAQNRPPQQYAPQQMYHPQQPQHFQLPYAQQSSAYPPPPFQQQHAVPPQQPQYAQVRTEPPLPSQPVAQPPPPREHADAKSEPYVQLKAEPPLPSQPAPPSDNGAKSEPLASNMTSPPPLPPQPAPPLPASPVKVDPQPSYAPQPVPPSQPQPQSNYSNALYSRQQAYMPVNTQQHQPPPQPQQQYHQPQVAAPGYPSSNPPMAPAPYHHQPPPQPPLPIAQPQFPSVPVGNYGQQPAGYHPQHQYHAQPPSYVQPSPYATAAAAPRPAPHFQPPLPRSQPSPQQQQSRQQPPQQQQQQTRPPPPTYCCHKCGQPGHWIQFCPASRPQQPQQQNNYQMAYAHPQQQQPQPPLPAQPPYHPPREHGADGENGDSVRSNYQQQQPPLPQRYGAPLSEPLPPAGETAAWRCETCEKSFTMESQYEAHLKTHVSCHAPDCDFSASKRVVGAHFQTAHGQYAGQGLKEIDVEGQKFMVLVGNSPEDIAKWRADRRKKWPSATKQKAAEGEAEEQVITTTAASQAAVADQNGRDSVSKKRKLAASSLADDEDLEDGEIEEDESVEMTGNAGNGDGDHEASSATTMEVDSHPVAAGAELAPSPSSVAEPSTKKQRRLVLCRKFMQNNCRYGDKCRFSHDRKAFPCRSMVQKGTCTKGDACLFSHDAHILQQQTAQSVNTKRDKALEATWKAEQGSLLRKLLKRDIHVEQERMLQIVRHLVTNQFFIKESEQQPRAAAQPVAESTTNEGTASNATV